MQQVWQDPDATQSITLRLKPNVEEFGQHERTFAKFLGGGTDEGQNEAPELFGDMDENLKWFAGPVLPNSTWPHRKYFVMADRGVAPETLGRVVISLQDKEVEIGSWAFYIGHMMKNVEDFLTLRRVSGHTVVVDVADIEKAIAGGDETYANFIKDLAARL